MFRVIFCLFFLSPCFTSQLAGQTLPSATVHELAPGLKQLSGSCNSYLLIDQGHALLFDPGSGISEAALKEAGVEQIDQVLLTAHHREKLQGLSSLPAEIRLAASKAEAEILRQPSNYRRWYPNLNDPYSVYGTSYVRPPAVPVSVATELADRQIIEWRGHKIHCIETAGHSPGSMSFIVRIDGKSYALVGGLIHAGAKISHWYDSEWDYGFAAGIDELLRSIKKLQGEAIDVLLPAYGPVILDAKPQLSTLEDKLQDFRSLYVRGYPVEAKGAENRDPVSQPCPIPHLNKITDNLYKLDHTTEGRNFAILISDDGYGLVLDCGLLPASTLDEIIVGLRQHRGLKGIDALWISHMHGDHFLLAPHLKEKYAAQLWTLDLIADACEHPRDYDHAAMVSAYGDGFDGIAIDRKFQAGEVFQWRNYQLQMDWMPGQTRRGCCLWLDMNGKRYAFTGDNLFGSPADEHQNGHEAVVCRNDAVLEEGYLQAADYLKKLKPDVLVGSHSYVMDEPAEFIQRYHQWAEEMIVAYQQLLPGPDYHYGFDPYWVSAHPYRLEVAPNQRATLRLTVKNYLNRTQTHQLKLSLPTGLSVIEIRNESGDSVTWEVEKGQLRIAGENQPSKTQAYLLTLVGELEPERGMRIVPIDITVNEQPLGQLFDFLIAPPIDEKP